MLIAVGCHMAQVNSSRTAYSTEANHSETTLAILVLILVEWTECRVGVQAIVARQN